jgi:hypothetical protein
VDITRALKHQRLDDVLRISVDQRTCVVKNQLGNERRHFHAHKVDRFCLPTFELLVGLHDRHVQLDVTHVDIHVQSLILQLTG